METPEANLSRSMQWLGVSYSLWFNRRHDRAGHLFQGRFKAQIIEDDAGWQEVARYIHLNPVRVASLKLDKRQRAAARAGLISRPEPHVVADRLRLLREFRWSSYRGYAGYCAPLDWVCPELLDTLCGGRTLAQRRAALREYTEQAVREGAIERPWARLVAGLVLRTEEFARRLGREARGNSREQAQLKKLTPPVGWPDIVSALERIKGEPWNEFGRRHGDWGRDWGRDAALWLGAIYHVMNRGDRREAIFQDDHDRENFLKTLGQACEKTDWLVHAWCLMGNHFHLVVETPRGNLVDGMKWLLGTYTSRFNRRHNYFGHVFSGRYKALVVDGSGTGYLKSVCDYVHLNPVRAKLLAAQDKLTEFGWSSYGQYLKPPGQRPRWLAVTRVLGEWGIPKDSPAGREHFALLMETRRASEDPQAIKRIERGWCYGSPEFRQELLEQMEKSFGAHHGGKERQESAEAKAERLLAEELGRWGLSADELAERKKGDRKKVKIALRLRRETTMSWNWIAQRLVMGAAAYAANCARTAGKAE